MWKRRAIGWAGDALKRVLGSLAVVQPYEPNAGPVTQLKHIESLLFEVLRATGVYLFIYYLSVNILKYKYKFISVFDLIAQPFLLETQPLRSMRLIACLAHAS